MPWKNLYESCVAETNPDKLRKLVYQLEEAIVLRYHDLAKEAHAPSALNELQAIKRAAQRVLQLKTEKLGWSNPAVALAAAGSAPGPIAVPVGMDSSLRASVLAAAGVEDVKESAALPTPRRSVASRLEAALLATRRAWQNWVFKN